MADGPSVPKILVVDDYANNRLIYSESLRELQGVEIIEAAHGQRALQLAREHDFAMFLLDINMPDMDGLELASLLRQEPRAEATPIVFVTAEDNTDRTFMTRSYRMGAVDFMVSAPIHMEILVQKARVFIELFRKRQELMTVVSSVRRENQELQVRLEAFILEHDALRTQATHDTLTKLPNRALFHDRMCAALARSARNRQRFALAYVDLDGFKAVNDRHGHATGDALIVSVADRLSRAVRATDTVARLGGDEFAVLFEGLDSAAGVEYCAQKIHRVLTEPVQLRSESEKNNVEIRTGASIGVAIYPDHATAIDDLVTLADMTMYAVKRAGGGVRVYPGHIGNAEGPSREAPHLHLIRGA